MRDIQIQMKLLQLESHLNIMEREITDFSETWTKNTVAQRIDDLRVIFMGMQGIVQSIIETGSAPAARIRKAH